MVGTTTPSQAWAILNRHARDDIAPLRLKDLCTDNDRITSLVTVHSGSQNAVSRFITSANNTNYPLRSVNRTLIADFSRQRMTLETVNHLLRLATAVDVRGFILTLAWGQNDRFDPISTASKEGGEDRQRHFFGEDARTMNRHSYKYNSRQHEDASTVDFESDVVNTNNRPMSPSRSVISNNNVKKTRFAQNSADSDNLHQQSDDVSTVYSHQPLTPSPSYLSTTNKVPFRTSPSMHMSLRTPSHCKLKILISNATNALDEVHSQWKRVQLIASSIRKGQMRGASGQTLSNLLIIGKGVAFSGIQFIYKALKNNEEGFSGLCSGMKGNRPRAMRFLSSLDPVGVHSALSDWDPENTCVISIILNEEDTELLKVTQVIKKWLIRGMKSMMKREEIIIGKHVLLVTSSEGIYNSNSITKAECTFLIPSFARCEAFTTTSVAGILPLAIAFGWGVVQEILNGAHDLDTHFVETNPRHNLPVLLALVDLWNDHFLPMSCSFKPSGGKMITPYIDSFECYPAFVATLESQVCGRTYHSGRSRSPHAYVAPSGVVVDGGLCGSFDRMVYQGRRAPQCELLTAIEPQLPSGIDELIQVEVENEYGQVEQSNQDYSICSYFAHADTMAFGGGFRSRDGQGGGSVHTGMGSTAFYGQGLGSASFDDSYVPPTPQVSQDVDIAYGNRPSTLLLCSCCDPFTIGQLIALSEHRAIMTAKLWDIEHFAFTQQHGSNLKSKQVGDIAEKLDHLYQRLDLLGNVDEDDDTDPVGGPILNLATTTLLGHYATMIYQQKLRSKSKR